MLKRLLFVCGAIALAACQARAREPQKLRLKWEELNPQIAGKKVEFVLPDGTHAQGEVGAVEAAGIRMKITKTSNRKVQPKGNQLVPRQSVAFLRFTERRGWGRLIGTVAGIGAAAAIVGAQDIDIYEGPLVILVPAVAVVGAAGCGVAGYYTGRAIDKRITEITIVP